MDETRRRIGFLLGIGLLLAASRLVSAILSPILSGRSNSLSDDADYRSIVIFRNDDLEPDHHDDLRREVDRIFIEEEVPVTNAVIPTVDGEPIDDAETFCEELRGQRRDHPELIEYSLHGFDHEPNDEGVSRTKDGSSTVDSEFGGLAEDEQRERLREGCQILSDCLGRAPRSFVPPYATYDEGTVDALAAEDFTVVGGGGWFTETYFGETEPFETDSVVHVPEDHGFVEDWESNAFYDEDGLRREFDDAYENGEIYVHGLHYWTFDSEERLERLRSFVRYIKDHDDVLFLTLERFADAYRNGRLSAAGNGWAYTPADDEPVFDTNR